MKAVLGLENGEYYIGEGFGVEGSSAGELVFTTQMGGYMEALSDPGYQGQILMFTYPLIGNYGVHPDNFQSSTVHALGCVVRELCKNPASTPSLGDYYSDNGLLGISGIDTRKLTIATRLNGTMGAALIVGDDNGEYAVECARKEQPITGMDLISQVSCKEPYHIKGTGKRIAVLDLGMQNSILASLKRRGADLYIFPHTTRPDVIEAVKPQALVITNGPGDPMRATDAIKTIQYFIGKIPVIGVCMGNQVAALALGGETCKMKFGHRGSNQPVRHRDGKIFITAQNHGFAVDKDTLPEGCEPLFTNVNDGTLEGFVCEDLNLFTVQFHPEAHSGPYGAEEQIFDRMYRRIP
ncbi:MAG: glutamine-hydrolyzing carbamoyl-phosphate synthase small subunit [Methanomicrobiales archaeon]|jgi:carbamoyl-phosphate synthase small subunit|nr:glutamine-hydrolyzing carbamoyl-phosphate synthase small subunit [Methanomicrobiales archaeon]